MLKNILNIVKEKITNVTDIKNLHKIKIEYLGKSSIINSSISNIKKLPETERKNKGDEINQIKKEIMMSLNKQELFLKNILISKEFDKARLDLTIPEYPRVMGSIHPITQCLDELIQVFSQYGFNIKDGPDIEDDWYNFTALNIDEYHPARQMHDTFYLNEKSNKKLLRTHTSPVQIRVLEKKDSTPCRFISPGRTYRSDSDITHTPMFHQIEGIVIDENIHMGHLKHTIIDIIHSFFENKNIKIRFRPSFFPFTEPSAEVDIKMNDNDNWLEVLGCGMVHPTIFEKTGIEHTKYQGFAFGLGVERMAMLKYNIKDLRKFFEGDIRWLKHYNFTTLDIPTLVGGLTR